MVKRKGLGQANTFRTNNNTSTGYGVAYADEVSGHRTVANLTALYALNDWQLSASGNNTDNDAIGQLWYVVDADGNGNGALYQLKDWNKRKEAAGWSIADYTTKAELGGVVENINTNIATKANAQDVTNAIGKLQDSIKNIAVTGGASTAAAVTFDNAASGMTAVTAQAAIEELNVKKLAKADIVQELGNSEELVMSQKAVSDKLKVLSTETIYDVSARNDGAVFESLQALLSSSNLSTLIPTSVRCGGMSIRFVQSSDNKYVQYRYIGTSIDTANFINTDNWVSVEDEAVNAVKKLGIESGFNGKYIIKDENGNIAFVIDAQGLKARKYNICDANGTVIGTLDASVLESLLQKQDQLVSGVNIATVNGEDLLKGGNIDIGIQDDNFPRFSISDENGNIALILDKNGLSVGRLNIVDTDGNVLGMIDADFFGVSIIKDDIVVDDEVPNIKPDVVIAKVLAKRTTWRNTFVTSNSKTVYWDITNGLDTNDGLSETTAVQSFTRVKELLVNGDTLLIKRGSIITYECNFGALKGLKIDAYGDVSLDNPVFDNFVVLSGWEKVEGYEHIYRASRNYVASLDTAWNVNFMQCFIDGKRLGNNISSNSALADKVSCRDIISYEDAMTYLDANPDNACWFDGYIRNEGELPHWDAGEHYWYISLSDSPSSHNIEVSNNICLSLCRLSSCEYIDISNISQRGMPNKDGWQIGRNVIMENCKSIDQANYGFLLQGGSWYCINCEIVSKSGAVNTQFHYFGDTPMYDYSSEYAFIGCSVVLNTNRIFGSKGFAGHYTDAHTLPYVTENIYIIGCRCEGVHQFVSGYKSKNVFIKDAEVVGVQFVNSGNNIIIDGLKGTVNGDSTSFVYIDNTNIRKLLVRNAVLKFISSNTQNNAGFISITQGHTTQEVCPLNAVFKDCRFIIDKGYDYKYNFITPTESDIVFEHCNFAVKSNVKQYISPRPTATNLHFKDCRFFGVDNNITAENMIENCEFKSLSSMNGSFNFVDNNIVKSLNF